MKKDSYDKFENLPSLYTKYRLFFPDQFVYSLDNAKSLLIKSLGDIPVQWEIERYVLENYFCNSILWFFEDKARDTLSNDAEIASVKRAIDYLNQKRNDAIEFMNEFLRREVFKDMNETGLLISETPGALIDRLSILHLKKYSLEEFFLENKRDSDALLKYDRVVSQISDLMLSLKNIYYQIKSGNWYFKLYFNNKLYNNPKYNKKITTNGKAGII